MNNKLIASLILSGLSPEDAVDVAKKVGDDNTPTYKESKPVKVSDPNTYRKDTLTVPATGAKIILRETTQRMKRSRYTIIVIKDNPGITFSDLRRVVDEKYPGMCPLSSYLCNYVNATGTYTGTVPEIRAEYDRSIRESRYYPA
jgi:hypothetical protein